MTEDTQKDEPTKEELLEEARKKDIEGRSSMNKDELAEALGKTPAKQIGETTDLAEWRQENYEGVQEAQKEPGAR